MRTITISPANEQPTAIGTILPPSLSPLLAGHISPLILFPFDAKGCNVISLKSIVILNCVAFMLVNINFWSNWHRYEWLDVALNKSPLLLTLYLALASNSSNVVLRVFAPLLWIETMISFMYQWSPPLKVRETSSRFFHCILIDAVLLAAFKSEQTPVTVAPLTNWRLWVAVTLEVSR